MKKLLWIVVGAAMILTSGSVVPAQTVATTQLMREKLAHSQKILEALMTSNHEQLGRESEALSRLTLDPAWDVLKNVEYGRYSTAFTRATQDLREAAASRNSDAAAISYVSLTLTCYECHRYLKGARIVR